MLLEDLKKFGVDVDTVVARFAGNQALCEKFMRKFLEDQSFAQAVQYYEEGKYEEVLRAAHTLKGVGSNLGLDQLAAVCNTIVQKLRAGDKEIADEILAMQQAYEAVTAVIGQNC